MTGPALDIDEVRDAISALTSAELFRLRQVSILYAVGIGVEGRDVLNEAVCRALSGTRTCPREVPVVTFLTNVMRSMAFSERTKAKEEPIMISVDTMLDGETSGLELRSEDRNAEEMLAAREDTLARLQALEIIFADDEDAQIVIMGDLEGLSPAEIRALDNWSEQTYATVRRRMRRKITAAYPTGWTQ